MINTLNPNDERTKKKNSNQTQIARVYYLK